MAADISKGIEFLNEQLGRRWTDRIELDELDMSDYCNCVLGQLGGSYSRARDDFGLSTGDTEEMGFEIDDGPNATYSDLQDAWYDYILRQQEG